jgi:hypothetical protein
MSGTLTIEAAKQTAMAREASAKVWTWASGYARSRGCLSLRVERNPVRRAISLQCPSAQAL